jgi:amino acid adenylation domain-containing protein
VTTYAELWQQAGAMAQALRAAGLQAGEVVAVCAPASPHWVAALLGIWRAGCAYLPIDPTYPQARRDFMLADAVVAALIGDPAAEHATCLPVLPLRPAQTMAESDSVVLPPIDDAALAYVIYTSGSTGQPKGVEIEHRSLRNLVEWHRRAYDLGARDRSAQIASVAFDAAVWEIWPCLAVGASLHFPDSAQRANAVALRDWLLDTGISVTFVPTPLAEELLALDWPARSALRALLTGGDRLTRRPQAGLPFTVYNHYGPTEATVVATAAAVLPEPCGPPAIGWPIDNVEVLLLDEARHRVPAGSPGELCIAGIGLARGYRGRPELTAERFGAHPERLGERLYCSGDWARLGADGQLEFLGRRDRQLKVRGYRIEAGEVEVALARHPEVARAVVVPGLAPSGDVCLVAFVQARDTPADASMASLRAHALQHLPDYMVPARFEWLTEWPLTPHGKLDRDALARRACEQRRRTTTQADGADGDDSDDSADAVLVRQLLAQALNLPSVGAHDNFFELGGNSLRAGRFVHLLRQASGVELPLSALFDQPSAAGLTGLLEPLRLAPRAATWPQVTPRPEQRAEPFPLTDVQQAYYLGRGDAFELGNVACRLYLEFDSDGVDLARLETAFQQLVRRHDMLRAVAEPGGRQRVLLHVDDYRIERLDSGPVATAFEARRVDLRERLSHEVRDPHQWPLFDLRALVGAGRCCLFVSFDLLILDGFSLVRLFDEWRALYHDPGASLPELHLTFRDYVLAEREWQASPAFARARAYWLERIDSLPPGPALPLACEPASIARPRFERREAHLAPAAWRTLQSAAARLGVTPSALLCCAYAETLARWSRPRHFTLNLTLFNRLPVHSQVEQVLGDFTTLTLLACDLRVGQAFARSVQALQRQLWRDLDQRDFSGVRVMREWAARHELGAAARMPVVFTSLLEDFSVLEWFGRRSFSITQTPQVWLDHVVMEHEGGLRFHWDAVSGLFPAGLLDDMFAAYTALLERLAADEASWQSPVTGLLPEAHAHLVAAANATTKALPQGLLQEPFRVVAARQPERPALRAGGRTLSYRELGRRSAQIGHYLRGAGARPNTCVAVVMEKGWEQVAAVLGTLESGAAYVPLDPDLPTARLTQLLQRIDARQVLTQTRVLPRLALPATLECLCVDDDAFWSPQPDTPLEPLQQPGDLAYVIFTSGSTGEPKGVMIDHRGALNTVLDINTRFAVGTGDSVLGLSSLGFDLSVYDIFGTLAAGGLLVLPDPDQTREPEHWLALVQAAGITVWNSVPALLGLLVDHVEAQARAGRGPATLAPLRTVLLSGDWIPLGLPGRLRALAPEARVFSLGGATEASIWSIAHPITDPPPAHWTSVPYGLPLANQTFHVFDEGLEECPLWVPGQLHIGGIGLALGYLGDEAKTAAAFLRHPVTGERLYRTGDLGRWRPEGLIEFLGREDTQVKVQGHRIELGEIEAALLRQTGVREAVALVRGARDGDRHLLAFYVPQPGHEPTPEALRDGLARSLPAYMLPSLLLPVERLPLSANGKVDRRALLQRATSQTPPRPAPSGPKDTLLDDIAALASEVLGRAVSVDVSLVAAGAASIDLMRLAGLLERRFGIRPSMAELFRLPSVAALAAYFGERLAGTTSPRDESTPDEQRARTYASQVAFLFEPSERAAFRRREPGRRVLEGTRLTLRAEPDAALEAGLATLARTRRTQRRFAAEALATPAFDALLALLAKQPCEVGRKFLYGSAGGLYPVQTYVYVAPDRVQDVPAGTYYYDPFERCLVTLSAGHAFGPDLHFDVNRQVFAEAAFALHLVADLGAIAPLYGAKSRDYCLIEAGLMTQLLELQAPALGIGLCQIGELAFEPARAAFRLETQHLLMHTLLGGPLPAVDEHSHAAPVEAPEMALGARRSDTPADAATAPSVPTGTQALPLVLAAPSAAHEPFPLMEMQQALWVGRSGLVELGQVSTHAYFEFDSVGLDAARLERAWQRLVARHAMLRAVVQPDGRQRVLAHLPEWRFVVEQDLAGLPASARTQRLADTRERLSHQVLPTDRWPLFESVLSHLPDGRTRYHLSLDSQFIDALSGDILFDELGQFYADPERELEPLTLTFRDYAQACEQVKETDAYRHARDYWMARLETLPPAPQLPLARGSLATPARFERLSARLEPRDWERLKQRCQQAGLTPSGVLCAAFADVLAAWSASPRFTLNLTVYNRWPLHPQVHRLIGQFTGVELLEIDAAPNTSFRERAAGVQQRLWQDLEQRYFHGVEVLRELGRRRREPAAARMPVVFTSMLNQPARQRGARAWDFLGERVFDITQTPQVFIEHDVMEEDGALVFYWDHVRDVFAEGVVAAMFAAYCGWLRRLTDDDNAWRAPAPDFLPEEQRARRAVINARVLELPATDLPTLLARRLPEHADRPAVIDGRRRLTHAELELESRQLAAWLRAQGARPGRLIAIVMDKGWEQAVAVLGVLYAGAAYVPIDAGVPSERLRALLEHAGTEIVLTQSWVDARQSWPSGVRRSCLDVERPTGAAAATPNVGAETGALACVIYTSGSTGAPKGVMVAQRALVSVVSDTNTRFAIGPSDRVLSVTGLHHDMSAYDLFGMLAAGGCLVLPDPDQTKNPAHWCTRLVAHDITVWNSVPALMGMLLAHVAGRADLMPARLRWVFLGGDWIPLATPGELARLVPAARLVSVGGPTETTLWNICHVVEQVDPHWVSIPYGKPMANQRYRLLDEALRERPDGVPGEMYCAGLGVALGYWRDQTRTREAFIQHPTSGERLYRTGDLGRYLPDGSLEFLGRRDLQVKVLGYRVELGEVEAAAQSHPDVRAVSVVAVGATRGEQRLVGYYVPAAAGQPEPAELAAHVATRLPAQMLPGSWQPLDALPLTSAGKVDRRALVSLAEAQPIPDPTSPAAGPADPVEAHIAAFVARSLGVETLGRLDDFFALGGNSLTAIQLIAQVREAFHVEVPVTHFFEEPHVAGLTRGLWQAMLDQGDSAELLASVEALAPAEAQAALLTEAPESAFGARP